MSEYLPKLVGIDKACEWLSKRTGDEWSFERLLECGLSPYFWLDWTEDSAPIFKGRTEGMLVWACFASDSERLMALGKDFRATMFVLENDDIVKCGPPGIPVPLDEIRFKRDDLIDLASKTKPIAQEVNSARLAPYTQQAGEKIKQQQVRNDSPDAALERVLREVETEANALGEKFDVNDMPGQIEQFWDLCQRLDPVFRRQTSIDSFKRYTKTGRCKWSLQAKANPDAEPLYRKLFPEAYSHGGAATKKRQKA